MLSQQLGPASGQLRVAPGSSATARLRPAVPGQRLAILHKMQSESDHAESLMALWSVAPPVSAGAGPELAGPSRALFC